MSVFCGRVGVGALGMGFGGRMGAAFSGASSVQRVPIGGVGLSAATI